MSYSASKLPLAPKIFSEESCSVHLNGNQSLVELTGLLNEICHRSERAEVDSPVVVWLRELNTGLPWPDGDADIYNINKWEKALHRLERLNALVFVVVEGDCNGAALDMLLVADVRIAAVNFLLLLPLCDGQFWPGMALYRLANQLGRTQARQLVLRESKINAEQAVNMGLIDSLHDELVDSLPQTIASLSGVSGREFSIRRRLLLEAATNSFEEALGVHLAACDRELRRR